MSFKSALWRYLKGVIFAPYYVARTHELVSQRLAARDERAEKHKTIYKDVAAASGVLQGKVLSIHGLKLNIDPARSIETVNEVILRGDYDFREDDGEHVLIDIGMNVGFTTLLKASNPRYVHVYSFEPLKPTYEIARRNIELNPELNRKISTFNIGLSNGDEEIRVKFAIDDIMSVSSEGTFDDCFGANVTEETIKVRGAAETLRPIMEKHKGQKVFIKLDCEGAEFKILPDLDQSGLLAHVHAMIIEWHNRSPDELLAILRKNGFFYFIEKINLEWNVGMIRAVRAS